MSALQSDNRIGLGRDSCLTYRYEITAARRSSVAVLTAIMRLRRLRVFGVLMMMKVALFADFGTASDSSPDMFSLFSSFAVLFPVQRSP